MRCCLPSLRPAAFPPPSPPPTFRIGFVRGFTGTTQPSYSSPLPQRLRLFDFPPWPVTAWAAAGEMKSPGFRRVRFVRDRVSDHGRAPTPRIAAPDMLPSTLRTVSASATFSLSRLISPPHTIAMYASPRSSPPAPQHSLPGRRYPLPGPVFHRLDRASFAWRTRNGMTQAASLPLPVCGRTRTLPACLK
jgi:hypothetical protein